MEFTLCNLRIIADDLGLHRSVNDGIIYLLKNGFINGASLMANGEAFDDAVRRCSEAQFTNIGVHLVLVEERPLTQVMLPKNHKTFFIKYVLGLISPEHIESELRAQLNKCVQAGIKPSFINSHQHLHLLPEITDIVIKLAREYQIPYVRIVNEPPRAGDDLFRKAQLIFLNLLSLRAKKSIIKSGLKCNDFFVGFVNAGNLGEKDIKSARELLNKYPDKIIELGCHPGFEDDELIKKYKNWGGYHWQKETELIQNLKF